MTGNDSEFARWLGVNKSSVCRARKSGRLVLAADGKVDFEASAAKWRETAGGRSDVADRHAAARGALRGANEGADVSAPQPQQKNATAAHGTRDAGIQAADLGTESEGSGSRAKAKALLLHYENGQIKLEMALRRGLRFERAAVRREAAGVGAMLRAGIERLIDQTAPRLAAASNELDRRRILAGEIARLRWVIKRELPRAMRRMKSDAAPAKAGGAE